MSSVKFITKLKNFNFFANFSHFSAFTLFWLGIRYELVNSMDLELKKNWSVVWVIMGRRGVSSERRRSSCSSYRWVMLTPSIYCWAAVLVHCHILKPLSFENPAAAHVICLCFIFKYSPWWRHQMETFSALLAICAGNLPVPGEFPAQRPVTRSFDVYFNLRLNKRLSKQSWGWWFEMPSWS